MGNHSEIKASSLVGQASIMLDEQLTPRQLEVLALLCEGLPNKLIGRRLNIACGTVKIHVMQILRALNVSSRLQAVIAVRGLGLALKSGDAERMPQETATVRPASALRLTSDDWDKPRVRAVGSGRPFTA